MLSVWTARPSARRLLIVLAVLTMLAGFLALLPAATASATPTDDLVGVAPFRAADTRDGTGGRFGALSAEDTMPVSITGPGVPSGAKAVSLNVTVTQPRAAGFVTAYPCGRARPVASNLNFTPGLTIANAVISGVGTGDRVCFFSSVPTHLIVDVNGYLPVGSSYQAVTPYRVTDTRPNPSGPMLAGQLGRKQVAAPGEWAAVALNVTAVNPGGAGFMTVYPCGTERPTASNLNFVPGQTVPNAVVSAVGADGKVCFFTSASTHLVVDVVGYFPAGANFAAGAPKRVLDSRATSGLLSAGQTLEQQVAQPGEAVAVAMNVTATQPRGAGWLTVYPCSAGRPLASNLNYTPGRTVPNMVWSQVDAGGRVCVYTSQPTHLIIDVTGTFRNVGPPGPVTALTVGQRTGTSIRLSWTNPSDLDLAEVAVRRAAGSVPPATRWTGTEVPLSSPKATSVTDTALAPGSQYAYAVFTTDLRGNITGVPATVVTSTLDTTPPGRVTNLNAEAASPGSVLLSWTNPTDADLAEVIVRRATGTTPPSSPSAGTGVPLGWATASSVTDNGLAAGGTYSYAVFTKDGSGNVQPTPTTCSVTTPGRPAPAAVTGLSASEVTGTSLTLSWTNPTGVDLEEIIVRRATGSTAPGSATSGTGVPLPWPTATAVTDNGLTPGTTYSYAVFTRDTAGNTSDAVSVSAATPAERQVAKVTAGYSHSCGLDSAGKAWCWGSNDYGQLGDGTATRRTTPVQVSGGRTFTQISAGYFHTCALDTAGKVWCWGPNNSGQLGDGTGIASPTPVALGGGRTFSVIDAGGDSACAIDTAGTAWCWGYNNRGQLGNNGTSTALAPTAVSQDAATFRSVSVGAYQACALDSTGRAWCWGFNNAGQLGEGTTLTRYAPTAVATDRVFSQIETGTSSTCALETEGRAWCWGSNSAGQLGNGGTSSSVTPTAVAQGSSVLRWLSVGSADACAIDSAGKAWCWGSNSDGQLGDGSGSTKFTPSAVSGTADYTQVAAGSGRHTCGRTTGGQVRCWGSNPDGQVGDGTSITRNTPVSVIMADTTPPGPVTGLTSAAGTTSITLSWTNPTDADLAEVIVRRATGTTAPGSATSGTGVSLPTAQATSVTDGGLTPGTTYSYAVFTRDGLGNTTTTPVTIVATTL